MNKNTILIALALIIGIIMGCQHKKSKDNNFYNYIRDRDLDRVPLIQPYEIISADKGEYWQLRNQEFDYKEKQYYNEGVEKVGIYLNYIILYTSSTYFDYKMTELWVVINTNSDSTSYYIEEDKYKTGIRKMGIKLSVTLYTTTEVFKQYEDNFTLPKEWRNDVK